MPLRQIVELECDFCVHCDHSGPTLAFAKQDFIDIGYITVNGRWYCDYDCRDKHKITMQSNADE